MSSSNGTSGIGGVKNLRAIFENKPSDDRSASPPSRGRSPALSEASIHSRPVSKVRASFVVVERPDDIEEGQHWGLRKASDVTNMADTKQEIDDGHLVNGAQEHSQSNGVHLESKSQSQSPQNTAEETTQAGLGSILKGSAFEASPPASRSKQAAGAAETPTSPRSQKKNFATSTINGKSIPVSQTKSIGSKIKEAVTSNHIQPPSRVKLNTTKEAKPIKPPPTRQAPPTKHSANSPTSPRTPRTPLSPKMEKPATRGSAAKPIAIAESAKNANPAEQAKTSPTSPRETKRTSLNVQSPPATRHGHSSLKANELKKDAKPLSPEAKPRRVPISAAAPTAASAARTSNATTLGRKPTVTRRDPPPAKSTTSTAPPVKKPPGSSLPAQTNGANRTKPRTSTARKAPDEGFLARMMRPTTSSAQKAHEKVAPSSPPQSKRAAPAQATKGKARRSLLDSDEDKENNHRGGQEINSSPSAPKDKQVEANGSAEGESQPLNDITPVVESEKATANLDIHDAEPLNV